MLAVMAPFAACTVSFPLNLICAVFVWDLRAPYDNLVCKHHGLKSCRLANSMRAQVVITPESTNARLFITLQQETAMFCLHA